MPKTLLTSKLPEIEELIAQQQTVVYGKRKFATLTNLLGHGLKKTKTRELMYDYYIFIDFVHGIQRVILCRNISSKHFFG